MVSSIALESFRALGHTLPFIFHSRADEEKEGMPMRTRSVSTLSRLVWLCLAMSAMSVGCAPKTPLADRDLVPQSQRRVLVVSIDGMRPDVLLRSDAPNIRALMREGSFTFYAESTDLAVTLPTHVSMLTGWQPKDHGILINDDSGAGADQVLRKPTLFELAKAGGYSTAMVASKSKFSILNKPGTIDWAFYPTGKPGPNGKPVKNYNDDQVGQEALDVLRQHHPQVLFVHFPGPDTFGHAKGWGTQEQISAVANIDGWIGKIVSELDREGVLQDTLILLTADHGGAVKTHGGIDSRSRYIPFIAVGPGVRQNYDLTLQKGLVVHVEDTFATALEYLGVQRPEGVFGKPVWTIYAKLPKGAPTTASAPATRRAATAPATSGAY
jgi:predicted AlkP superfamily pyrophosphatase or phosphodiesterase